MCFGLDLAKEVFAEPADTAFDLPRLFIVTCLEVTPSTSNWPTTFVSMIFCISSK